MGSALRRYAAGGGGAWRAPAAINHARRRRQLSTANLAGTIGNAQTRGLSLPSDGARCTRHSGQSVHAFPVVPLAVHPLHSSMMFRAARCLDDFVYCVVTDVSFITQWQPNNKTVCILVIFVHAVCSQWRNFKICLTQHERPRGIDPSWDP